MDSAVAAVVAVLGTLFGSALTYIFQRRTADHVSSLAAAERRRQEGLEAHVAFTGAAVRYRTAALDRWHRYREDPQGEEHRLAHADFHRLRTALIDAQLRMDLLTGDAALRKLANLIVDATGQIHDAATDDDRAARTEAARVALDEFVERAATRLREHGEAQSGPSR